MPRRGTKSGSPGPPRDCFRALCLGISASWCLVLTVLYGGEWDGCAALTLWPPWFWAGSGMALAGLAICRSRARPGLCLLVLWMVFLAVFAEETAYPVRALRRWPSGSFSAARRQDQTIRVVSINCCGGQTEALAEAGGHEPDVVLVQEAPGEKEVARLARRWFGKSAGWHYGGDACVIARGSCTPDPAEPRMVYPYAWARVRLPQGIVLVAVSVHLLPPQLRHDLWKVAAWESTASLERGRRQQLRELAERLHSTPADVRMIVGGDFNVPAYDGIMRLLRPRLHDSFRERGAGWGNTVLNEFPVSRFDQIWLSESLRSESTAAIRTRHSDHRMVVSDVTVTDARVR